MPELLCSLPASARGGEGVLSQLWLGVVHLLDGQVGQDQKAGLGKLGATDGRGAANEVEPKMPRRRLPVLCLDEAGGVGPFPIVTAVTSSEKEDT
jgi:hypothetical protein